MTDLPGTTGKKLGLVIDLDTCVGCHACVTSCKEWNTSGWGGPMPDKNPYGKDPAGVFFNRVQTFEAGEYPNTETIHFPKSCLHCEDPGCLNACPAPGAIVQYENGIVDFNQDACIGCQYCVTGCPFDIPRFDEETRKVYKCNMCIDRVEAGLEPACVKTCPTNAIHWGKRDDMVDLAERKVERLKERGYDSAAVYDPEGVGGVHMMYVVPHGDRLADYDLPENPTASPGPLQSLSLVKGIGSWLFGFGILATLLHYLGVGPDVPEEESAMEEAA